MDRRYRPSFSDSGSSLRWTAAPLLPGSPERASGVFADFLAARRLEILLRWTSPGDVLTLMPLRVSSWHYYFLIAFALDLRALHRLAPW